MKTNYPINRKTKFLQGLLMLCLSMLGAEKINAQTGSWLTGGNSVSTAPGVTTSFLGTLDNAPLIFKMAGVQSGFISGNIQFNHPSTAFGYNTLSNVLNPAYTGNWNTAIGLDVLNANMSGQDNTGLGAFTLSSNVDGTGNTGFGLYSLNANVSGGNNTGVGNGTLTYNLSNNNTAVGATALNQNISGNNNSAIGYNTLDNNTIGNFNTAIGTTALSGNIGGLNNTAVGFNALDANISGNNNTALGSGANVSANNLTNATAIGANSQVGESNAIVLGSLGPRVNVGIGTTTPGNTLEIQNGTVGKSGLRLTTLTTVTSPSPNDNMLTLDANNDVILVPSPTATPYVLPVGPTNGNFWSLTGNALGLNNPNNQFIGTTDANPLTIKTGNATALTILPTITGSTTNGFVGIGTTTPTAQLHTTGTVRFQGLQPNQAFTTVVSVDPNGNLFKYNLPAPPPPGIQNACANTNFVTKTLNASGNLTCSQIYDDGTHVGIGTTTPGNTLEIKSPVAGASGLRLTNLTTLSAPNGDMLTVNANHDVVLVPAPTQYVLPTGPTNGNFWGLTGNALGATNNNFLGTTNATSLVIKTGGVTAVTILPTVFGGATNGFVGIGTTTPTAQLNTTGTVRFQGLQLIQNVTTAVAIDANGNLFKYTLPKAGVQNACVTANLIPKNTGATGNLTCSQIFDNGTSVGIGTTTAFNYTGLTVVGPNIPAARGVARLAVNGVTMSVAYYATSDERMKKNIQDIPNALDKVMALTGKTYQWKTDNQFNVEGLDNNQQIGFIAQDLAKVLPQAVIQKDDGSYAVNYNEVIPVLVEAVKTQQQEIASKDSEINNIEARLEKIENSLKTTTTPIASTSLSVPTDVQLKTDAIILNQNDPNPFAESTVITYSIPSSFSQAQIVFTTVNGQVIKTVPITTSGEGQLNVFGNNLTSGLYIYTLIVDGQKIESKEMVKQ